jgi:hypothetical protein
MRLERVAVPELMDVLRNLDIGARVAEDEADALASYFVETDQFQRILNGDVDVVFGPKGAGKSAIYASVASRTDTLFDKGITLIAGEIPRGAPAFADLMVDPPTSEREFVGLWKFYVLSLVNEVLEDFDVKSESARVVRDALRNAGLAPAAGGLRGLVRRVRDYVSRLLNAEAIEGGIAIDPNSGQPIGITGKIVLGEPTAEQRAQGLVTADDLLAMADEALSGADVDLWVMFDRLDVAFAESRELEANALRSLFRVYLDTLGFSAIRIKIFLRTDVWQAITKGGFREASHVTREATISWTERSLLHLVVRRLLNNDELVQFTGVDPEVVLGSSTAQREWFDRLVPDQIDSGRNPKTFEWIIGRVKDGLGVVAPREVIHLLTLARDEQLAALERGEDEPADGAIFSRAAFRDALPGVSRVRLEKTIYAEYPDLQPFIAALDGEKTNQSQESLSEIWRVPIDEASEIAGSLVEVGFFELRGQRSSPDFWVPFLYRPALNMVQGSAD